MTAEEMDKQTADLLLACHKAQRKLEHLRIKASGMGARLVAFGGWMQTCPERQIYRHNDAHCGFHPAPTTQEYVEALSSPSQYFDVAQEIRETLEILGQLEQKKERLGLK